MYDCLNYIRLRGLSNIHSKEINVNFFNNALLNFNYKHYTKQMKTFAPFHYHEVYEFVKPYHNMIFNKKTYAITLWKDMWLKMGLDTNKTYHFESIYQQLKRQYSLMS